MPGLTRTHNFFSLKIHKPMVDQASLYIPMGHVREYSTMHYFLNFQAHLVTNIVCKCDWLFLGILLQNCIVGVF